MLDAELYDIVTFPKASDDGGVEVPLEALEKMELSEVMLFTNAIQLPESLMQEITGEGMEIESLSFGAENALAENKYWFRSDDPVPLTDIMSAVGLSGVSPDVSVSDDELPVLAQAGGQWTVTPGNSFEKEQTITVTLSDGPHGIPVMDGRDYGGWELIQQKIDSAVSGDTICLNEDITAEASDTPLLIDEGNSIVLDLNGHTIDGNVTEDTVMIVRGSATISDSVGSGEIISGSEGILVDVGTLTMKGAL